MPNDSREVLVAANAHIYVGATGSPAPTDAETAPEAQYVDLGYVTQDGIALTPGQDIADVMVHQEFYPVRRIVTAKRFEAAFTLAQVNDETLKLALGGGTTTGSAGEYEFSPPSAETLDERSMILDLLDGSRIIRIYIPTGMVTQLGTITFSRTGAATLPVTFGATASGAVDPFSIFASDPGFLLES